MKVTISSNVCDPFFDLNTVGTTCEVDEEIVAYWAAVMEEFNQVQKEMSAAREKAKYLPLEGGCE
jgi:hypothetical protein